MAYKGRFKPLNPTKYDGDPTNIIYRSMWELTLMRFLDSSHNVLKWSSEEIAITYRSPVDGKIHRYFPDFLAEIKQKDETRKIVMIEVKPYAQTQPPSKEGSKSPSGRPSRRYINAVKTYAVNDAKWKAARAVCESRGWEFKVMTEYELGISKRKPTN